VGGQIHALVDRCIASFPSGEYTPYLLARRAFSYFQARHLAGNSIEPTGHGWNDLRAALTMDRFNAFGNFVTAKVQLAIGDCRSARTHVEHAFERSSSYPTLIAALETEASVCPTFAEKQAERMDRLRTMINRNPASDAFLHLYMLMAALSMEDCDSADLLVSGIRIGSGQGKEEETIRLLQTAMADPRFAADNIERLRRDVGLFIWGRQAVDRIVASVT